ncbi:hypothetical protein [Paracidovorax valerianellae]|uniref:hypothetical protein n=1 Tax=Paracidovorax valerianellae TaxID=187868 RepID=UPI00230206E8|nr:hypothetical protein [Paracidovorax valerianellae]MDA8445470.1 hypothetical protein [Paracidovorax valerianellae]
MDALVQGLLQRKTVPIESPAATTAAGWAIPPQEYRVPGFQSGPCNHADAGLV